MFLNGLKVNTFSANEQISDFLRINFSKRCLLLQRIRNDVDPFQNKKTKTCGDSVTSCSVYELKAPHMLSESKAICTMIGNDNQCMNELIRWTMSEINALREPTHLNELTFHQNRHCWEALTVLVEERELVLAAEIGRAGMLLEKVKKCRLVRREAVHLEHMLLVTQAEGKALEDEATNPICVHPWMLLQSANLELANLFSLRTSALNRLHLLLARTTWLKVSAMHYAWRLKKNAASLRSADEEKGKRDEWLAKIETTRTEITEEKEQFFAIKWKEAQVVSLMQQIRELPLISFLGG
jgi:hypothetical protein